MIINGRKLPDDKSNQLKFLLAVTQTTTHHTTLTFDLSTYRI